MTLFLPKLKLFDNAHGPHRRHVLAERDFINSHGVVTRVVVYSNWPETKWWAYAWRPASKMLASNTISTSSLRRVEQWIFAVKNGDVVLEERDDLKPLDDEVRSYDLSH